MCAGKITLVVSLCDPMDYSLLGSSVHGILQARILEWVAISSPGDLPDPGIKPMSFMSPELASGFFTTSANWESNSRLETANSKKACMKVGPLAEVWELVFEAHFHHY